MIKKIKIISAYILFFVLLFMPFSCLTAYAEKKPSRVILTFDDGPSLNTVKILSLLKKHDIKASFFVVKNPYQKDVYQKILSEGHILCGHSSSHSYGKIYASKEAYFSDLKELDNYIYSLTSTRFKFVRLPGGSRNSIVSEIMMKELIFDLKQKGYVLYDWNVESQDGQNIYLPPEEIARRTISACKKERDNIVLLHDAPANKNTFLALESIITTLKAQGYVFANLDETLPVVFPRKG